MQACETHATGATQGAHVGNKGPALIVFFLRKPFVTRRQMETDVVLPVAEILERKDAKQVGPAW
jgi:hypothetical protein